LDVDLSLPLFTEPLVPTIVITSTGADPRRLAATRDVCDVITCGEDAVDLAAAIEALVDRGLTRIHSEGGPRLLADLVAANLLDELLLTMSPNLAGGSFAGTDSVARILAGAALPLGVRRVELHQLLHEDSNLFASYRFDSTRAA
jgi:riboflavin biosynthesis pyrimidine reductase